MGFLRRISTAGLLVISLNSWCSGSDVIEAHKGEVFSLVFSPDGKHLLSGGTDGFIRLWDAKTHRLAGMWKDHVPGFEKAGVRPGLRLAISPDGSAVAAGSGTGLHIWDFQKGSILREWSDSEVKEVVYLADGRLVFSTKEKLLVWDGSGKETKAIPGPFRSLSASADGRVLGAVDGDSRQNVMWSTLDWSRVKVSTSPSGSIVFSPKGARLLYKVGLRLEVKDLASGKRAGTFDELDEYGHQMDCTAWAKSPGGDVLAIGVSDGRIALWPPGGDHRWLQCERRIRPVRKFLRAVFNTKPLGYLVNNMYVGGMIENSGMPLELPFRITALAFSPDGSGLAAGTEDGNVVFYGSRQLKMLGESGSEP